MDSWITDWQPSTRLPYYTRANAGETLPDPASPLGWSLVFEQGLVKGWRQGFIDFGVYRETELPHHQPPMVGMFGGYFYLSLSGMRLLSIRMGSTAEAIDAAFLGSHPDAPPYIPHPDDPCPECSEKVAATMAWVMTATSFPEVDGDTGRAEAARAGRPDLEACTDAELVAHMRSFLPELENAFYRHDFSSLASTVGPAILGGICATVGRPELQLDLISGIGDVASAAPSTGLWDLSRSVRALPEVAAILDAGPEQLAAAMVDPPVGSAVAQFASELTEFLGRYGYRGPNEWDIHSSSWEAKPVQVLALVERLRMSGDDESPSLRLDRLQAKRNAAAVELRGLLADDPEQLATFEKAMHLCDLFIPARERTKANAVIFINEVRLAALELGRRAVLAGRIKEPRDLMMLMADELDGYIEDPDAYTGIIAERLIGYEELWDLVPPFIFDAGKPMSTWERRSQALETSRAPAGTVLSGGGGASGTHTGVARVVLDPADPSALEPGDILVAPITDAAWTPLFLVAGAVVVDVGAINSHAIVVCRELGIPCVVSVTGATTAIPDGAVITVDGNSGTVTISG